MRLLSGTLCKGGAEGVLMAAAPTGAAAAMKITDGSPRPTTVLALAALAALGVDITPATPLRQSESQVLGGGKQVGEIHPSDELIQALSSV